MKHYGKSTEKSIQSIIMLHAGTNDLIENISA